MDQTISETAPFLGDGNAVQKAADEQHAPAAGKSPVYAQAVSTGLDVFKGCFVFFMLTEHAREVLFIPYYKTLPLHIASNLANSMDMVCYSFAYGYACYRSYLSDCVPRSIEDQRARCVRSVALVWAGACVNDYVLAWRTGGLPSLILTFNILIGYEAYWAFVRTFPLMLLVMYACHPVIDAAYSGKSRSVRLAAGVSLLAVPLLCSCIHLPMDCLNGAGRFVALFVDCQTKPPALIFPALPYLVNFNFGILVAMLVRRWTSPGIPVLSARRPRLTELVGLVTGAAAVAGCFGLLLFTYRESDFSVLDAGVFRRFPPNIPWLLGCMSFGLALFVCTVAVGAHLESARGTGFLAEYVLAYFQHLGANVLLYLTLSNVLFYSEPTPMLPGSGAPQSPPEPSAPFTWAMAAMAIIGVVHILVKGSRK